MAVLCIEAQGVVVLVDGSGAARRLVDLVNMHIQENHFWACGCFNVNIIFL